MLNMQAAWPVQDHTTDIYFQLEKRISKTQDTCQVFFLFVCLFFNMQADFHLCSQLRFDSPGIFPAVFVVTKASYFSW